MKLILITVIGAALVLAPAISAEAKTHPTKPGKTVHHVIDKNRLPVCPPIWRP